MREFEFVSPDNKAEVLRLLAEDDDTRVIAGGTGLINLMRQHLASPARLVSLHKVDGLRDIAWSSDRVEIGALARLIDIEGNAGVAEKLPVLRQALHEVASPRIRSMATLGGALAHADPNQDLPVALMALDATVLAESSDGSQQYPIAEFLTDYYETALASGELVTGARIDVPSPTSRFGYKKFTPQSVEDYACVGVCIRLDVASDGSIADSRVVLGSVGPTIFRAADAENILAGKTLTAQLAAEAAEAAMAATDPVDDARGSAAYKRDMTGVWVRRLLAGMA